MSSTSKLSSDAPVLAHPCDHGRIIGHKAVLRTLADAASRMPNGILLYGDRGIGKATIAYRIARFFLGARLPAEPDTEGAGEPFAFSMRDTVCARMRAEGCADLRVLAPVIEKSAKNAAISVNAVREAGKFLQLTSSDSGRKCVIIDAVDDMNTNAQNALLKMLEEPAGDTVLILIAHRAGAALPTVRSRCRPMYVPSLTEDEARRVLHGCFPSESEETLAELSRAAAYSPGRAAAFHASGVLPQFKLLASAFTAGARGDRAAVEQAIERLHLPAGDNAVWQHLLFMATRFLSDAAADGTLPYDTAVRYHSALSRLTRAADAVHLDRKTVLLNSVR